MLTQNVAVSALLSLPISGWGGAGPRLLALAQREQVPLRTAVLAALSLHQQTNRLWLLTLESAGRCARAGCVAEAVLAADVAQAK